MLLPRRRFPSSDNSLRFAGGCDDVDDVNDVRDEDDPPDDDDVVTLNPPALFSLRWKDACAASNDLCLRLEVRRDDDPDEPVEILRSEATI
jgi:hypothetical protein